MVVFILFLGENIPSWLGLVLHFPPFPLMVGYVAANKVGRWVTNPASLRGIVDMVTDMAKLVVHIPL